MEVITLGNDAMTIDDQWRELASTLISTSSDSPILRCDWCGRECETHVDSYDNTGEAILDLLAHAAFDHASRALIIEYRPSRIITYRKG